MVKKVKDIEWISNKLEKLHAEQNTYLHVLSKAILPIKYNGQFVTHGRVYRIGGLFDIGEMHDVENIECSVTEMALSFNGIDFNKLIRYHNKLTKLMVYYFRLRRELINNEKGGELHGN